MTASAIANALHTLAAVVWIGGAFFAYVVLRPATGEMEAPDRIALWRRVFDRFFPWVWIAVFMLPATGFWAVRQDFGGFANTGPHVHAMTGIGMLMIFLFVYLYGGPYKRFTDAVDKADWSAAGSAMGTIRHVVGINLILGLITVAIGSSGRFW